MAKELYWVSWMERHDSIVEVPLDGDDPKERARELALNETPPMGERTFEFEAEVDDVVIGRITNLALREFADLIIK